MRSNTAASMTANIDTWIVFCCDQGYFPLAKGMVLSILEHAPLAPGIGLAFLDIGCDVSATKWLLEHGVRVRTLDPEIMGDLADPRLGYRRSQVCRPFLPKLFPDAAAFIWIDCDAWVQDTPVLALLRSRATEDPGALLIAPECHYSYTAINENGSARRKEMFSYYEPTFGAATAARMCERPTLNSGVFALAAASTFWAEWQREVERLYLREYGNYEPIVRHMAEQIALNVIAARGHRVTQLDPLYNYVCLWTAPVRDAQGIVRVALPPHVPIGIVHLAGGWKDLGPVYFKAGLLYRSGAYLTEAERSLLFPATRSASFR